MLPAYVMVVDDDFELRSALGEVLSDAGYEVALAADGAEALRLLQQGSRIPDVILLDLMMPVMNGWQFLAQKAKDPALAHVPVIAVSAVGQYVQKVEPVDAVAFLRKPVHIMDLLDTVRRYAQRGAA